MFPPLRPLIAIAAALLVQAAPAGAAPSKQSAAPQLPKGVTWEEKFYNPKPDKDDLVLPMPCGGAMVFRRVVVPGAGLLDDRRVVLGGDDERFDIAERTRQEYVMGGFSVPKKPEERHFWLAKYEVSQLQSAAMAGGECPSPSMRQRLPAVGAGWFDAVRFGHAYTGWLMQNAFDLLPREDGQPGFLRLPTEVEWEYAARGGVAVGEADFQSKTFPTPDGLHAHAWYQGTESANGKLQLTGLLSANPLGLYDMLGNAEEIVLDPFRINKLNRLHGQAGAFVTKGGHYLTNKDEIRSSYRREYAHFDMTKRAASQVETIGFRLALAAPVITDRNRLATLRKEWLALPSSRAIGGEAIKDPVENLDRIAQGLGDLDLRHRLQAVGNDLKGTIAARNEQQDRAIRAAVRLGAFLGEKIEDDSRRLAGIRKAIEGVSNIAKQGADVGDREERFRKSLEASQAILNDTINYYADTVTSTATDYDGGIVEAQRKTLTAELGNGKLASLIPYADIFARHVLNFQRSRKQTPGVWAAEISGERKSQ
ncbi:MAG: SUMF1/EgtB/PvdO family nonheme iron enzyme [Phaeospirillum sp.]|nr:SUMF1/EgtB/PvdO family nonheme iron enzyme [Phaeospirillum sp.]